ncbi:hypothetical protein DKM44_13455 [Deinococcus irradiatisoli]|uniref:Uncharacterized protein n=1 Tax=Deinococcus irradiatisoli TaxID=2202254 RepID=A0A2Z3JKP5_9DEIO|nr:hypothetical protein [Deinococcus irradiatisoli]AWN24111.1 hypothetical protein DKM44_13455 [Deinococcus irradiatisoli]
MKPLTDPQLDDFLREVRRSDAADLGAADRFLARQVPVAPSPVSSPLHRPRWPAWLAAAALVGAVAWLRPGLPGTQPLPSSAAYAAYSAALGSEW